MRKLLIAAAALCFLALGLSSASAQKAAGTKDSITGEVIDTSCYMKKGAKGAAHAKCAETCAKAGAPLSLLTDEDKVVFLVGAKDPGPGANPALMEYVAKRVAIDGVWYERGGTKVFEVQKVTAAK
jgi:hypothetical protein